MIIDRNFKEFILLLNKNRVKYLIVGGYAVALHGHPRYTKDLDIWIYVDTDNADRLKDYKLEHAQLLYNKNKIIWNFIILPMILEMIWN